MLITVIVLVSFTINKVDRNDQLSSVLARILWLDSQLTNAVLNVHTGNEHTFDRVTELQQLYVSTTPPSDSDINLNSLITAVQRKSSLIERYKSVQAQYLNSAKLAITLDRELRRSAEYTELHTNFDSMLNMLISEVVRSMISGSDTGVSFSNVELTMDQVEEHPEYGSLSQIPEWAFFRSHIHKLTEVLPKRNQLFKEISSEPVARLAWPMSQPVESTRENELQRLWYLQIASFVLSLALLLLVAQKVIEIWRHRNELEVRVDDRTKQLSETNKALIVEMEEKEQARKALAQAQKLEAIGQLSAGIAHEINTPTQYVQDNIGFLKGAFAEMTELLQPVTDAGQQQDCTSIEELREKLAVSDLQFFIEEIPRAISDSIEGVERISGIVRALKEFAHPAKNKSAVDINRAIKSTSTVATNEWKYVADMEFDLDVSLPDVPCVAGEINQVILNMIVNASHAIVESAKTTGKKGLITICTKKSEEAVEIIVQDSGAGMPPDVTDRIFEPFYTTKEIGKGTGQGLAIAHNVVVEKHGGSIDVQSEVGIGTQFVIRLPLSFEGSDSDSSIAA